MRVLLVPALRLVVLSLACATTLAAPPPDFNGDGYADLAVGAPGETIASAFAAGEVTVIYGSAAGLAAAGAQRWTQADFGDASVADDRFGAALAWGDFNGDGRSDLAIGAPGDQGRGRVFLLHGSPTGLVNTGAGSLPARALAQGGSAFGAVLATGDFARKGCDALLVGAPLYDDTARATVNSGRVQRFECSVGVGLNGTQSTSFDVLRSDSGDPFFPELRAQTNDQYGAALAVGDFNGDLKPDIAVGAPGRDLSLTDVGGVAVIYGAPPAQPSSISLYHQHLLGLGVEAFDRFGTALAAGDFDHDGFDDLAIGVPNEDVGAVQNAGAVTVFWGASVGTLVARVPTTLEQSTASRVGDPAEANDGFGRAVAAADFNGDGFDDLAAGVPLEDVGANGNAGALHVFYGLATGLGTSRSVFLHQNASGVLDVSEAGDNFAMTLTVGDFDADGADDLAAGIPGENLASVSDGGAMQVLYGTPTGITAADNQFWTQAVQGVAASFDAFGGGRYGDL